MSNNEVLQSTFFEIPDVRLNIKPNGKMVDRLEAPNVFYSKISM